MARPLKSAAELCVTGYQEENPPPKEFKPRLVPISPPEPSAESILKLSEIGWKGEAARKKLIAEGIANLLKLSTVCPAIHAKIEADLRTSEALRAGAADLIEATVAKINDVETMLKNRGDINFRIHTASHNLSEAEKKLNSPSILELAPEGQLALANEVRFMPAKIDEMKKEADELKAQILAVAKSVEISIEATIRRLGAESGKQPNSERITDSHLHQMTDGGFLDLK